MVLLQFCHIVKATCVEPYIPKGGLCDPTVDPDICCDKIDIIKCIEDEVTPGKYTCNCEEHAGHECDLDHPCCKSKKLYCDETTVTPYKCASCVLGLNDPCVPPSHQIFDPCCHLTCVNTLNGYKCQ